MPILQDLPLDELQRREKALLSRHDTLRGRNRNIDMTRGKPSSDQLDLSNGIFSAVTADTYSGEDGDDYRNYGMQTGVPEARA
ncbi:MAG: aminotransferase, partial [Rhodospirillaceae bacterium]|nr:aminotransferase [Rhodospirillaceae bacterium]